MARIEPSKSSNLDIKPFAKEAKGSGAKWSAEDRRLLFMYVERCGAGNWTAAALGVPGKTAKQVWHARGPWLTV